MALWQEDSELTSPHGPMIISTIYRTTTYKGLSLWWRSKMWRSPFSPQMHPKYICMWNSYRTPTECWQKTQDFQKGKKSPQNEAGQKIKKKTKTLDMGPDPQGGSRKEGKYSAHSWKPLYEWRQWRALKPQRRTQQRCSEGKAERIHHRDWCQVTLPSL